MCDAINGLEEGRTLTFEGERGEMTITNDMMARKSYILRFERMASGFDKVSTVGEGNKSLCLWFRSRVAGMLIPSDWRLCV